MKILEWFQHDADLPKWQTQVSGRSSGRHISSAGSHASTPPNSGNGVGGGGGGSGKGGGVLAGGEGGAGESVFDARGMDFVIDEMALACQVRQGGMLLRVVYIRAKIMLCQREKQVWGGRGGVEQGGGCDDFGGWWAVQKIISALTCGVSARAMRRRCLPWRSCSPPAVLHLQAGPPAGVALLALSIVVVLCCLLSLLSPISVRFLFNVSSAPRKMYSSRTVWCACANNMYMYNAHTYTFDGPLAFADSNSASYQYCQRYLEFVAADLGLAEDQSTEFFAQARQRSGGLYDMILSYDMIA